MPESEFCDVILPGPSLIKGILELQHLNYNSLGIAIISYDTNGISIDRIVKEVDATGSQSIQTSSKGSWTKSLVANWQSFYSLWSKLDYHEAVTFSYSKPESFLYANNFYIKGYSGDL